MMMSRMTLTPVPMTTKMKTFISPHHDRLFYIPRATQTSSAGPVIFLSVKILLHVSSLPLVSPDHWKWLTVLSRHLWMSARDQVTPRGKQQVARKILVCVLMVGRRSISASTLSWNNVSRLTHRPNNAVAVFHGKHAAHVVNLMMTGQFHVP